MKRPKRVTLLTLLVFLLALFQTWRAVQVVQQAALRASLSIESPWQYFVFVSGAIALLAGVTSIAIWAQHASWKALTVTTVSAWQFTSWVNRIWFDQSSYTQTALEWHIAVTIFVVLLTILFITFSKKLPSKID